jgi:hypothetical protein
LGAEVQYPRHSRGGSKRQGLVTDELSVSPGLRHIYDGDGTLVKKVVDGETTIYVGAHFEKNVSTGEVTKYYTRGDRRVTTEGK